jgi:hypothetical protein
LCDKLTRLYIEGWRDDQSKIIADHSLADPWPLGTRRHKINIAPNHENENNFALGQAIKMFPRKIVLSSHKYMTNVLNASECTLGHKLIYCVCGWENI